MLLKKGDYTLTVELLVESAREASTPRVETEAIRASRMPVSSLTIFTVEEAMSKI